MSNDINYSIIETIPGDAEFENLYSNFCEDNICIALKDGINVSKETCPELYKKGLMSQTPSLVFKYEIFPFFSVGLLFGENKDAHFNSDGTISPRGANFDAMRKTNMMDKKYGIISGLCKCGNGKDNCKYPDPFAEIFCREHHDDINPKDIIKFAVDAIKFKDIPKKHIVFIEINYDKLNLKNLESISNKNCACLLKKLIQIEKSNREIQAQINLLMIESKTMNDAITSLQIKGYSKSEFELFSVGPEKRLSEIHSKICLLESTIIKFDRKVLLYLSIMCKTLIESQLADSLADQTKQLAEFDLETNVKIDDLRKNREKERVLTVIKNREIYDKINDQISEINKIISQSDL